MNLKLRGHIVWNGKPKKKKGKWPSKTRPTSFHKSNLLRSKVLTPSGESKDCEDGRLHRGSCCAGPHMERTNSEDEWLHKGCARQNSSPSTQRTDFSPKNVKTYGNTKSCAGHKRILRRQRMVTSKVVTKRVPQHATSRLRSEGCEDGWQHKGRVKRT